MKATKYADLKSPSVTQLIMSLRRKDEKEEYETLEEPKSHTFGGGNPSGLLILFKYLKVRIYRGFFPGKTCNLILVGGIISFYNKKLQIWPVGGSDVWKISMR